jgi:hypothetical protein
MDIDLDRSNTRRTAVSAVSGISDPQNPLSIQSAHGSLNVPGRNGHSQIQEGEGGTSVLRSSPTPPSPMGSASREVSPEPIERTQDGIKSTELHVRQPSGEDLYSASPRLPKPQRFPNASNPDHAASPENVQRVSSIGSSRASVDALGVSGSSSQPPPLQTTGLGRGQGSTIRREVLRKAQEEKILIGEDGQEVEVVVDENAPPSMSATSYPGQEW